jgi:hypothetical protein
VKFFCIKRGRSILLIDKSWIAVLEKTKMFKSNIRSMMLVASCFAAVSAMGQNQASYADASATSANTVSGYAYRVDLKVAPDTSLFWEFKIKGADGLDHLVRITVPSLALKRNRVISTNESAPRNGLDGVLAGFNAVDAAAARLGVDTQIVRFEATLKSHGRTRYRVLLNVLNDGGGVLDQDLEVTLDETGKVVKIQPNDD